jgi:hypothetical protein
VEKGLSVRETEKIARDIQVPPEPKKESPINNLPEHIQREGLRLHEKVRTAVNIKSNNKGQGSLVIKFSSQTDLERILRLLNGD